MDEYIDPHLAAWFLKLGYNSKSVADVSLSSHSGEDVLAFAKREDRILVVNDGALADQRRFSEQRNPAVVIHPAVV